MRRVVVTGLGVLAPNGTGAPAFWDGLIRPAATTAKARLAQDVDVRVAEILDDSWLAGLNGPETAMDRNAQLAVAAAGQAYAQSGLEKGSFDPRRAGVIMGNGAGGLITFDQQYHRLYAENKRRTHPLTIAKSMCSSSASWVSIGYGFKGPTHVIASACASGTHAIGTAMGMIRGGLADVMLAGGTEAPLSPGTIIAWDSMRILAPDFCRPFSADRKGLILAEGAGMLMLEAEDYARARGATILGYVDGFAACADAGDMVQPDRDGMAYAMTEAVKDAGLGLGDIQYINAHGTGTMSNDRTEAEAVVSVFGEGETPPVSSIKGVTGHSLGAAGAVEAVATILALQHQTLPPTANHAEADPACQIDCVPNVARPALIKAAMSNSFAFGGLNASLILSAA